MTLYHLEAQAEGGASKTLDKPHNWPSPHNREGTLVSSEPDCEIGAGLQVMQSYLQQQYTTGTVVSNTTNAKTNACLLHLRTPRHTCSLASDENQAAGACNDRDLHTHQWGEL
jgi:hypothetical protein